MQCSAVQLQHWRQPAKHTSDHRLGSSNSQEYQQTGISSNVTQLDVTQATMTMPAASPQCYEWPIFYQHRQQSPNHVVQNLQPCGCHGFHILAYTDTVQRQRTCVLCLSFPTTTLQLCSILQLILALHCPGLECTADGSHTVDAYKSYFYSYPSPLHSHFLACLLFFNPQNGSLKLSGGLVYNFTVNLSARLT